MGGFDMEWNIKINSFRNVNNINRFVINTNALGKAD